ncbi:MAG: hypothetical protein SPL47_10310 [Bacteroidales bacterium]|nr:hypothetical protein [Bacteroidales bacterium]
MKSLQNYRFGFDPWGLILFLLVMLPNFIWLLRFLPCAIWCLGW